MSNKTSTDTSSFGRDHDPIPESQGQAALLLVESLMHSLLDNGALTKAQAIEALESAYEVKEESMEDGKEPVRVARRSLKLLDDMRVSIEAHSGQYDSTPGERRD